MRVRTEAKRQAILEAASAVFAEAGYERASMAEISTRIGGSKATLYGYFASKEALFAAVVKDAGERRLQPVFDDLLTSDGDLAVNLRRFGEKYVAFLAQEDLLAVHRMVMAEAGHSDVGRRFWQAGPAHGNALIAGWLAAGMANGRIRAADPGSAAEHLLAMLTSEVVPRSLFGMREAATRQRIRAAVGRAVQAFLAAYAI
jgi:AcrR family transcriptional regulator